MKIKKFLEDCRKLTPGRVIEVAVKARGQVRATEWECWVEKAGTFTGPSLAVILGEISLLGLADAAGNFGATRRYKPKTAKEYTTAHYEAHTGHVETPGTYSITLLGEIDDADYEEDEDAKEKLVEKVVGWRTVRGTDRDGAVNAARAMAQYDEEGEDAFVCDITVVILVGRDASGEFRGDVIPVNNFAF